MNKILVSIGLSLLLMGCVGAYVGGSAVKKTYPAQKKLWF
jgi:hypothetical protein